MNRLHGLLEPAATHLGYESYDGAWGINGVLAPAAYLLRTASWTGLWADCRELRRGHGPLAL